jgi:hypothetical protein
MRKDWDIEDLDGCVWRILRDGKRPLGVDWAGYLKQPFIFIYSVAYEADPCIFSGLASLIKINFLESSREKVD